MNMNVNVAVVATAVVDDVDSATATATRALLFDRWYDIFMPIIVIIFFRIVNVDWNNIEFVGTISKLTYSSACACRTVIQLCECLCWPCCFFSVLHVFLSVVMFGNVLVLAHINKAAKSQYLWCFYCKLSSINFSFIFRYCFKVCFSDFCWRSWCDFVPCSHRHD